LRPSPQIAFALRVLLAVTIAIYTAYWLELDTPSSAGTTAVIVAGASRGGIISKSLWRLFGTLVGAVAAVALIAGLVQSPVLFIVGVAAWIGVCTFTGSLLRYNRSYAAVLAGYTVAFVAFGALDDPERVFDLATGRAAVVAIGIMSTALVFLITDIGPGEHTLEARVAGLIISLAKLLQTGLRSGDRDAVLVAARDIATTLTALDESVEFSAVEDAGFARYKADLRLAVAEAWAALVGAQHMAVLIRRLAAEEAGADAVLMRALDRIAAMLPGEHASGARDVVRGAIAELRRRSAACGDLKLLAAFCQATTLLTQLDGALAGLEALQDGVRRAVPMRLISYANPVTAWRNGVRAFLAVCIAGVFWIVSQWPTGGSALLVLAPVCALLSQTDSAAHGSIDFLKGIALAMVAAFGCTYGVLPAMTGFPLLMVGFLPFIFAGVLLSQRPGYTFVGLGYMVFFITAVAPGNPIHYDLAASLNTYFAYLFGAAVAALVFRILIPPNPLAEARVLLHSVRNAIQRLAGRRAPPHVLVWEHVQHQKLLRLGRRLAPFPELRLRAAGAVSAAIIAGRHLAAIRHAGQDASLPASVRAAALRVAAGFRRLLAAPEQAAAIARAQAEALLQPEAPHAVRQVAATMYDLAELVSAHRGFFARGVEIPDEAA
jgi:uncharacterized membrane protein YccC